MIRAVGSRDSFQRHIVVHVHGVSAVLRRIRGATTVPENAEQPGIEALALLIPRQGPIDTEESLLGDVLGILRVA